MIEWILTVCLFLAIFATGWFHTFLGFLLVTLILEAFASFVVGFQESTKEDSDDGKERV